MQPKSGLAWAIVSLLCILQIDAENAISTRFAHEPPYKVEFSNSTGSKIPCSARGTPTPTIDWILADGTPVTDVLGLRQISPAGSLVFPPFKAENYRQDVHSIAYRCVASNSVGKIVSREVNVKAVMSLPYDLQVYDAYVIKGNTAALKCHFPNFIKDSISVTAWIKDNVLKIETPATTDAKFTMLDDTLYVADVTSSDSGSSFRCQITNVLTGENRLSSSAGRLYVTDPQGNMPPKIIESADSLMVKEGDMLILPCVAQGFPLPDKRWFTTLATSQTVPITQEKKAFSSKFGHIFQKTKASDTGNYMCSAQNLMGTEKKTFNVTIMASLSVRIVPQTVILNDHRPTTLHCQVSGSPMFSLKWLKNGQQLSSSSDAIQVVESGIYQCFAHNDLEMVHDAAQVNAGAEIPTATIKFASMLLQTGSKTVIQCSAKGNPLPTIKWVLDNAEVTKKLGFEISVNKEADDKIVSLLKIPVVKVEDGGVYRCIAGNSAGAVEKFGRLDVQGAPGIRAMNKMTGVAGKILNIHCPYYGYPVKAVSWEKGGVSLPNNVHQIIHENGTFVMKGLQRNVDDGIYTCIVDGEKGVIVRKDVQIAVLIPPRITPFSFQEDLLREGMRARLQCVVSEGDSPITIQWLKDSNTFPDQLGISVRHLDEFSSILTISSVTPRHNGNYTCLASNAAAIAKHSAILSVNGKDILFPFQRHLRLFRSHSSMTSSTKECVPISHVP